MKKYYDVVDKEVQLEKESSELAEDSGMSAKKRKEMQNMISRRRINREMTTMQDHTT